MANRDPQGGALLVFDEIITGFRYANGGAQEFFGVTPDLTTLGKGIANGFPLSAVCGRRDVMMEMEEMFFSFTMGGETHVARRRQGDARKAQARAGGRDNARARYRASRARCRRCIDTHEVGDFIASSGDPTWSFLVFKDIDGTPRGRSRRCGCRR